MSLTRLKGIFEKDKGASYSNEFEVKFKFGDKNSTLLNNLKEYGFISFGSGSAFDNLMFLCDEAALPGSFAATNEIDGMFTGRLIQYPHGRLYNDFRLSFIETNEMNAQKFFEAWFGTIFPQRKLNTGDSVEIDNISSLSDRSNVIALEYYDSIVCPSIEVIKTYKNRSSYNGGKSCKYDIINAYPYTIESVPLAYGASTLNRLRVQFRYEKHVVTFY